MLKYKNRMNRGQGFILNVNQVPNFLKKFFSSALDEDLILGISESCLRISFSLEFSFFGTAIFTFTN